MATARPTPRNPSGHKPEQCAPRTFGYNQKNVSFVANEGDALRFRTRIVRRGPRPRGLKDASRCLNMPLCPLSSLLNIFQRLSRYVEARTNTRVWSYGSAGRPAISLRNTFIPNSSGRLSARSGSLAHFFTVSLHVIAQKMVITNRWYVSCHLNSVPLCCRPTTSSPLTDRPTALLSSYLLLAAVIVALFGLASADSCRYYQGNISCCKRVLDRKRQGGLIFYRCRQCEDGHVLSDDKTQCVPDTSCASGTGPGLKNVAKKGECYSCSDDNCVRPG